MTSFTGSPKDHVTEMSVGECSLVDIRLYFELARRQRLTVTNGQVEQMVTGRFSSRDQRQLTGFEISQFANWESRS